MYRVLLAYLRKDKIRLHNTSQSKIKRSSKKSVPLKNNWLWLKIETSNLTGKAPNSKESNRKTYIHQLDKQQQVAVKEVNKLHMHQDIYNKIECHKINLYINISVFKRLCKYKFLIS